MMQMKMAKKERIDEESAFIGPLTIVQIIPPTLR